MWNTLNLFSWETFDAAGRTLQSEFGIFLKIFIYHFEAGPLVINLFTDHLRGTADKFFFRITFMGWSDIFSIPVYWLSDFAFGSLVGDPNFFMMPLKAEYLGGLRGGEFLNRDFDLFESADVGGFVEMVLNKLSSATYKWHWLAR